MAIIHLLLKGALLAPWRYDGDNYGVANAGWSVGDLIPNGFILQVSGQQSTALNVQYIGFYQGEYEISKPFVSGSGNDFTICRHLRMFGGDAAINSFPYAQLISGTKEGNVLKNVKMATIGLKLDTPNARGDSVEGQITLWSDADGISEKN